MERSSEAREAIAVWQKKGRASALPFVWFEGGRGSDCDRVLLAAVEQDPEEADPEQGDGHRFGRIDDLRGQRHGLERGTEGDDICFGLGNYPGRYGVGD